MTVSLTPVRALPLEQEITTWPREQLVSLLYDHLLGHLRSARQSIELYEPAAKAHHLERALAILGELMATLDHERGGEIAPRLAALYVYFMSVITEVGRTQDVELLQRISNMISALHESWNTAAAATRQG